MFTVSACDCPASSATVPGVIDEALAADTLEDYEPNSSSSAFASFRSRVSNPSVNQRYCVEIRPLVVTTIQRLPQRVIALMRPTPGT